MNQSKIAGTIDANGEDVGPLQFRKHSGAHGGKLQIITTGTFVGTLEVRIAKADQAVADAAPDATTYTAPFAVTVEPGGDCDVYVYASAWTSGAAEVEITS